jgi:hypothetical protein
MLGRNLRIGRRYKEIQRRIQIIVLRKLASNPTAVFKCLRVGVLYFKFNEIFYQYSHESRPRSRTITANVD